MDHQELSGKIVLENEFEIEDSVEVQTLMALENGQLGERAPQLYNGISDVLLILTQTASCFWGCRGGDHLIETLIGRLVNNVYATLRLSKLGLYHESLTTLRSAGEVANLLELFCLNPTAQDEWAVLNPKLRWNQFGPSQVRQKIEDTNNRPIVAKEIYAKLCEIGVHATPESARLSHQFNNTHYVGGQLSFMAFLMIINETALLLSGTLKVISHIVVSKEQERFAVFQKTAEELEQCCTSWLRITNYEDHLETDEAAEFLKDEVNRHKFLNVLYRKLNVISINMPEIHDTTSVKIYTCENNGKLSLPIFTSKSKAQRYIAELTKREQSECQVMSLNSIQPLLDTDLSTTVVTCNPNTIAETQITEEDLETLRYIAN